MDTTTTKTKIYLNALKCVFPYDNKLIARLISQNFLPEYVWNRMGVFEMRQLGMTQEQIDKLLTGRKMISPDESYALLLEKNVHLISRTDNDYPTMLENISDKPEVLYVQGDKSLLTSQNIAVVGPRKPSAYGKEMVGRIISNMAPYNLCIVSGLAYGIDSLAHEAAINNDISTIAVLGAGIGSLEPKSHMRLVRNLRDNHLVISEYPYHIQGSKFTFPQRNRLISGLSLATIIIEARKSSGSLITAKLALEQNREVFAVPGSLLNECSEGTNRLLTEPRANPFLDVQTMIETLKLNNTLFDPSSVTEDGLLNIKSLQLKDPFHKKIYSILSSPHHVNDIIETLGIRAPQVLNALAELELRNILKQLPGQIWIRA